MKYNKTVLIISDGSFETAIMAERIAEALKGNKVSVKSAFDFKGNDILPAEVIFLGCGKPKPDSFSYISDLFKHINLAGRPCGIFTPGTVKTAKYLAGLVKDCDAALNPEPLISGSAVNVKRWAGKVVSGSF